jgi:hypothetical protein
MKLIIITRFLSSWLALRVKELLGKLIMKMVKMIAKLARYYKSIRFTF